jgi:multidrug resistance efflux pump
VELPTVRGWRRGVGGRRPAADRPGGCRGGLATARTDLRDAENELAEALRALDLAVGGCRRRAAPGGTARRAFARQRDLLDRGVGSAAAVEDAELAAATAEQAVLSRRQAEAQAEARATDAETALERRASRWPRRSGNWPRRP